MFQNEDTHRIHRARFCTVFSETRPFFYYLVGPGQQPMQYCSSVEGVSVFDETRPFFSYLDKPTIIIIPGWGVHTPPETMMHSPLFQISPCFREILRLRFFGKFQKFYLFPKKFPISDDIFFKSSTTNFEFPPYFACFSTFPP